MDKESVANFAGMFIIIILGVCVVFGLWGGYPGAELGVFKKIRGLQQEINEVREEAFHLQEHRHNGMYGPVFIK